MDIVLVGDRSFSKHVFNRALDCLDVVGVVTPTLEMSLQLGYEPIGRAFDDVPLLKTDNINEPDAVEQIRRWDPDIGLCTSWTQIIDAELLSIPSKGWLGMHPSDLPRGRGGAAVNWSIIEGETDVTLSLFEFTERIDDGHIIAQASVEIQPRDTVRTVFDRLSHVGAKFVDELDDPQRLSGKEQDLSEATYRPSRTPKDGLIDWERDAGSQHDWIRALTRPYPGAFTFVDGQKLVIWSSGGTPEVSEDALPGEVIRIVDGEGIDVGSGGGTIRLRRVQAGTDPPMWADEWASRSDVGPGTRLGRPSDFPELLYTGIRDADGGFDYVTNLPVGESTAIRAYLCSHASRRDVAVRATLDDEELFEETVTVDGWKSVRIPYSVSSPGTATLTVTFTQHGSRIDRRYLKIYSPETAE